MPITRDEVRHIAKLANLVFSEEDQERFAQNLSAILDYVAHLDRLDTRDVLPTAHLGDDAQELREDVAAPPLTREEALANAPEADRGLFKVPKVLG
jgi:aspartyl-tRNA(Asn)/glutamyl-tRNA(Gln) amidotransferase subunit C